MPTTRVVFGFGVLASYAACHEVFPWILRQHHGTLIAKFNHSAFGLFFLSAGLFNILKIPEVLL